MSEPPLSMRQVGIVLLLSALAGCFLLPALGNRLNHRIGEMAPDFSLPVLTGGDVGSRQSLAALRGKAVLLDFWATWCGPCRQSLPMVERLAREHHKDSLVVLGINQGESAEQVRQYFAQHDPGYVILSDLDGAVSNEWGVNDLQASRFPLGRTKLRSFGALGRRSGFPLRLAGALCFFDELAGMRPAPLESPARLAIVRHRTQHVPRGPWVRP